MLGAVVARRGRAVVAPPLVHARHFAKAPAAKASKKATTINKTKKADKFAEADKGKADNKTEFMLKCLEARSDYKDERSVEELREWETLAKEYSRHKMRQHHALMGEMTRLLKLRFHAIAELPPPLQIEALMPDIQNFPLRMPMQDVPPATEQEREGLARAAAAAAAAAAAPAP